MKTGTITLSGTIQKLIEGPAARKVAGPGVPGLTPDNRDSSQGHAIA